MAYLDSSTSLSPFFRQEKSARIKATELLSLPLCGHVLIHFSEPCFHTFLLRMGKNGLLSGEKRGFCNQQCDEWSENEREKASGNN